MPPRRLLLECFEAAVRAVDGRRVVARALRDVTAPRAIEAFAVGKAAGAMMLGAHEVLGDRLRRALVITKSGHADPALRRIAGLTLFESAHPVPDERSLAAGAELAARVAALPADAYPVFLVSGGSSSLVEDLAAGATLEALRALNEHGLAAGWDIAHLNRERARLSRLKAGGVARLLDGRPGLALFLSDVPGDDPEVIGSGLLGAGGSHDHLERRVVAGIDDAVQAAIDAARAHGIELRRLPGRFAGDAADVAQQFLAALRQQAADGAIWGGESTVTLPASPGRGGRNQHLALCAARALRPNEAVTILAAGTDGDDGTTGDAGAMVDAGTVARAELGGVDVERAWRKCDSGLALEAAQDLVHTGPTGTNVGDLLIGISRKPGALRDLARSRVL